MHFAYYLLFVRANCEFRAGVAGARFVFYFCTHNHCDFAVGALGVLLRVLLLHFKHASFQPKLRKRTSRTAFALVAKPGSSKVCFFVVQEKALFG